MEIVMLLTCLLINEASTTNSTFYDRRSQIEEVEPLPPYLAIHYKETYHYKIDKFF